MKRILLIALFLMCIVGTVSAYGVNLTCPDTVQAGVPLRCSIDNYNFPAGTSFNLVLYQSSYTATLIRDQPFTFQSPDETKYVIFDTQGLPGGTYKAEIQYKGMDDSRFNSQSKIRQLVTIVDRSGDIAITSPPSQDIGDALRIEGNIAHAGNDGVEIEVDGPDGRIFGPEWIQTKADIKNNAGVFTQKVAVSSGGDYKVGFSDTKGFIGEKTFTVVAPTTQPTAAAATQVAVVKTTITTANTVPTPWPTTAQSPLSPFTALCSLASAGMLIVLMRRSPR